MKTNKQPTYENNRKKSVRLVCLGLAILMVLGTFATGITALIGASSTPKEQIYPPIFILDSEFFMVTNEIVSALPGEGSESFIMKTMGTQDELPIEERTANFGKSEVTISRVSDGSLYYHAPDGSFYKCNRVLQENDTSSSNTSSTDTSSSGTPSSGASGTDTSSSGTSSSGASGADTSSSGTSSSGASSSSDASSDTSSQSTSDQQEASSQSKTE